MDGEGWKGFRGPSVALSDLLVVSSACVVSGLGLVWLLFIGYRQGGKSAAFGRSGCGRGRETPLSAVGVAWSLHSCELARSL